MGLFSFLLRCPCFLVHMLLHIHLHRLLGHLGRISVSLLPFSQGNSHRSLEHLNRSLGLRQTF